MATLWRVEEAAEYLGIRPKTLYEWVRLDRVPYRKIGFNVRFDPDELARWTAKQARGADPAAASPQAEQPAPETLTTLVDLASDASAALRDLERDVGATLSFPQRRRLLELAERLEKAASEVSPD
ncbi:MAG: helix-turn-helix domain-containing protein [Acidobacteriota bacterium]|jgi:excisionase family DNA binding protein